jgi:tRNA pseudouridine55 synthase
LHRLHEQPPNVVPSSAAQRDIPPDIVYRAPDIPARPSDGAAFLVDKPKGHTSRDVVNALQRATGIRKVGHAGTLDPMATGLLIVLVARPATRLQAAFMHQDKVYEGRMRMGERTRSHDANTNIVERADPSALTREQIAAACTTYEGSFWQTPPMYSAVKIDGERLHEKARRGETVDRPPRQVHVDAFELLDWSPPEAQFRVTCSKGTYVRALARDVGADLGVGAHLTALRRTAIGPYTVEAAWALDALVTALTDEAAHP